MFQNQFSGLRHDVFGGSYGLPWQHAQWGLPTYNVPVFNPNCLTPQYGVNPIHFMGAQQFGVNPIHFTGAQQYGVNPIHFTGAQQYGVNPVNFTGGQQYGANPINFTGAQQYGVNPINCLTSPQYGVNPINCLTSPQYGVNPINCLTSPQYGVNPINFTNAQQFGLSPFNSLAGCVPYGQFGAYTQQGLGFPYAMPTSFFGVGHGLNTPWTNVAGQQTNLNPNAWTCR